MSHNGSKYPQYIDRCSNYLNDKLEFSNNIVHLSHSISIYRYLFITRRDLHSFEYLPICADYFINGDYCAIGHNYNTFILIYLFSRTNSGNIASAIFLRVRLKIGYCRYKKQTVRFLLLQFPGKRHNGVLFLLKGYLCHTEDI